MAKPRQERAICPNCGCKALGNTYVASHRVDTPFAYRQCAQCNHVHRVGAAAMVTAKPDFPRNKIERNVYDLFASGKGGGRLATFFSAGRDGAPAPARAESAAYAAWMAGNAAR